MKPLLKKRAKSTNLKQPWLKAIKIAIVEEDFSDIDALVAKMPIFSDPAEMEEAAALLKEAKKRIQKEREETLLQMESLKKQRHFVDTAAKKNRFVYYS